MAAVARIGRREVPVPCMEHHKDESANNRTARRRGLQTCRYGVAKRASQPVQRTHSRIQYDGVSAGNQQRTIQQTEPAFDCRVTLYIVPKKQVIELLNITSNGLEKLVKEGKLTRKRKIPGNNKSAWLYSAEELNQRLTPCAPSESCCQDEWYEFGTKTYHKKKWFQFWKKS